MLHRHSSLRRSALTLSLALGCMVIRVLVRLDAGFDPPINAFHHRILINITDKVGRASR
jgi:hypothetical protein